LSPAIAATSIQAFNLEIVLWLTLYGGYVLQCLECNDIFAVRVGRDIMDSIILSGAKRLDTYDDDLKNKEEILQKYGLGPLARYDWP